MMMLFDNIFLHDEHIASSSSLSPALVVIVFVAIVVAESPDGVDGSFRFEGGRIEKMTGVSSFKLEHTLTI
jgi:hypothetical protein